MNRLYLDFWDSESPRRSIPQISLIAEVRSDPWVPAPRLSLKMGCQGKIFDVDSRILSPEILESVATMDRIGANLGLDKEPQKG